MTGDRPSTSTGSCLRKLRELAGLTRRQVARRAGYSLRFLTAVERGEQPGTVGLYAQIAAVCAEEMRRITPEFTS